MVGFFVMFVIIEGASGGTLLLPQTGQTICYDLTNAPGDCNGTGQDGEIKAGVAWPGPRFVVSGDCVTDNLTGLMWDGNANRPVSARNWQDALNYVAALNSGAGLCGYTDWRLPNVNELESLSHAGQANPAAWLNTQGFLNVQEKDYWSSTSYTSAPTSAWVVYMGTGGLGYLDKSSFFNIYVWPVRTGQVAAPPAPLWKTGQTACYDTTGIAIDCLGKGQDGETQAGAAWPGQRFTALGECVADNLTGLMWAGNADQPGGALSWQDALNHVAAINSGAGLCGHTDWHLPNRKELHSLNDFSQSIPALPVNHPFTNVQSAFYWSSTSAAPVPAMAWIVSMRNGEAPYSNKTSTYYAWPVRRGTFFPVYLPNIIR